MRRDIKSAQRAWLHRTSAVPGFTKQYGCKTLVWYETHATMPNAITREKADQGGFKGEEARPHRSFKSDVADLFDELI